MAEVFLDAFLDTLKVFPFLIVIYIIIELIEHKTSLTGNRKILQGRLAPLIGSAAGIIPLCGFSVMASKLYEKDYIKTGTLLSVFIATSDEAVIILLTDFTSAALRAILPLLVIKFVLAAAVGYAVNALISGKSESVLPQGEVEYSCGHSHHGGKSAVQLYLLSPLWHSFKITLYLFAVNLAFGLIIFYVGEDKIAASFGVNIWVQPLITAAVGLIPSCASSVIVTSAYLHGGIAFGSMLAGLSVNAGMGFVVLMKNTKKLKRNLALLALSYAVAYVAGILVNLLAPYLNL